MEASDWLKLPDSLEFLQTVWEMKNVKERFEDITTRKDLLEDIIKCAHVGIPFQSITLMAKPPAERTRPSLKTIKDECMDGIGGLCYNINVFVWGLLKSLGYSAYLCSATCTTTVTSPNNHVIILIYSLEKEDDVHLVECGVGFPTFRAVSLQFEEESPVFRDSFLEYKYICHDSQILRMHGDGDKVKREKIPVEGLDFYVGKWRRMYYFSVKPSDNVKDFDEIFNRIFTVPKATPFDQSPRAICFPNLRAVIIVNATVMLEDENGEMKSETLDSDEKIINCYAQYFPQLPENTVRRAIQQWHSLEPKS